MTGINMVLNTAKGAIAAQQYGLAVTGHNIANVNNPDYSRQNIPHTAKNPVEYAGFVFGAGVEADDVQRTSDQLLEDRLRNEKSTLAGYEESSNYMNVIEKLFSTSSDSAINNLLPDFWNTWHDLSNNATGTAERVSVYEIGDLLSQRFNALNLDLLKLEDELNAEIEAAIPAINSLAVEIADLNSNIISSEVTGTANDLRDKRNALVSELGEYLDVKTFEQDQGDIIVTAANGYTLVDGPDYYTLEHSSGQIQYVKSSGSTIDVTDRISTGQLGGWLDLREEVSQLYRTEVDVLAREFIWAVNYQHSQGVGLNYLASPQTGTYATDASGLLDTLEFGNKIDYTKDFKMWIEDNTSSTPEYSAVDVDMGISGASATGWAGTLTTPGNFKYVLTVTENGEVSSATNVTEADGVGLGTVQTDTSLSAALASAIAAQTITVTDSSGATQTVIVNDTGGDADQSAASIASELNNLTGITAYASDNSATIDISNILGGGGDTEENDLVSFTLVSAAESTSVSFSIGADDTESLANFNTALRNGIADINGSGTDLSVTFSGNTATISSVGGENIGIEDFDVADRVVVTLDSFSNLGVATGVTIDNFDNFSNGQELTFSITTAQGSVNIDYQITDDTDQTTLATDLVTSLNAANLGSIGIATIVNNGTSVSVTSDTTTSVYMDFQVEYAKGDLNESFDITNASGTNQYPDSGGNTLLFDQQGNLLQYAGENEVKFTINGTDDITVDLRRIDPSDSTALSTAFYNGLNENVTNATVTNNGTDIEIAATAELSSFTLTSGSMSGAGAGAFDTAVNQGLPIADTFTLDGATVTHNTIVDPTGGGDIDFEGQTLTEGGTDSAVKTGGVSIFLENGYSIQSSVDGTGADGGVFNAAADTDTTNIGDTVAILGGVGGYSGFDSGDTIEFEVDGNLIQYTVGAGDDTDDEYATGLYNALTGAGGLPAGYIVNQNGASVSIKNDTAADAALLITAFADDGVGGGNSATLDVQTGYHSQTTLSSTNTSATSNLLGSEGEITWEKFYSTGVSTGETGTIDVNTVAPYTFDVTDELSFSLNDGTLVAGNTLTINTDSTGVLDSLSLTATGTANSILDTYVFTVTSGGTIGTDAVTMDWTNSITSGTITLPATGVPITLTPSLYETDGMTFTFASGTLFTDDEFTITTDATGVATVNEPSDWHWTLDSFADQFNRQAPGVTASINSDNQLTFTANSDTNTHKLSNFSYENTTYPSSSDPGFSAENVTIDIDDYTALTTAGTNFRIERRGNDWSVPSSYDLNYTATLTALDDLNMDNGFTVYLNDGTNGNNRAFTVNFDTAITNDGYIEFDMEAVTGNYNFGFSDDEAQDSGLTAALGINTFYDGHDAMSIEINSAMGDKNNIAAAKIDADSGILGEGDNSNALDITNIQFDETDIPQWVFERGEDATSQRVNASVEGYFQTMIGTMGIKAQSIVSSIGFAENMVKSITEQRDSLSAVSIDEEMINLMKYQHAYTVAAKLLSVADEMMSTLVNSR